MPRFIIQYADVEFSLQIYFLDLQIWYTVASAIIGGLDGAVMHLGEVGTACSSTLRLYLVRGEFAHYPLLQIFFTLAGTISWFVSSLYCYKLQLNPYSWVISLLNYVAYAKANLHLVMSIFWLGLHIWHLWQIRSLDTLRTRFSSLPTAFVKRLQPSRGSGGYQMYIYGTHVML